MTLRFPDGFTVRGNLPHRHLTMAEVDALVQDLIYSRRAPDTRLTVGDICVEWDGDYGVIRVWLLEAEAPAPERPSEQEEPR